MEVGGSMLVFFFFKIRGWRKSKFQPCGGGLKAGSCILALLEICGSRDGKLKAQTQLRLCFLAGSALLGLVELYGI